ncbi:MAG: sulfide/dihydroorotate dehydrogenase-like FAD/NAD-binding protein [Candidatus Aminicenantes bacterium]|nr:sulfide/dihydroorotate dehydrogenase-like FAD/NAD-binding protein [Candidatus Aminicenantes bacterium]
MAKILQRERLVPNLHLIEVEAPEIARKCKPGQFVIIMPDEFGERIPLTIADWNEEKGSVTSVFLVVGTSTHKLSQLKAGDEVPVVVGPLGMPSKIENYGTVLCVGGCFGIGAIYPIARALKAAGNKVLTLMDVKANYLVYWEEKLKAVSDHLYVSSRDSYFDCKDYIPKVMQGILKETRIDRVFSIGCTYLIYCCAEATRPQGIKTTVSLNPIMVDGTGMCGACRVTVGGKTKFACVDGPDFDGHEVDWDELFSRRKSYFDDEIQSLCYWERKNFP